MYSDACEVITGATQCTVLPVMWWQVIPNVQRCLWCDYRCYPMYSAACNVMTGYTQCTALPVMWLQVIPNIQGCLWWDYRYYPTYRVACDVMTGPVQLTVLPVICNIYRNVLQMQPTVFLSQSERDWKFSFPSQKTEYNSKTRLNPRPLL